MSQIIAPVQSHAGNDYAVDPKNAATADERKLNAIGYQQEFKRDMSAAG